MYRWILSLLALLGYTGMAAHAQQLPQSNHSNLTHLGVNDSQHADVSGDGSTNP